MTSNESRGASSMGSDAQAPKAPTHSNDTNASNPQASVNVNREEMQTRKAFESAKMDDSHRFREMEMLSQQLSRSRGQSTFQRESKNILVRTWDRFGTLFGKDGNFVIYSRLFKHGIFPLGLLTLAALAIQNPNLIPWNSWETHHERHEANYANNPQETEEMMLKLQKEALFLELRQLEVQAVDTWHREHPGEMMTQKLKKRLRNQIIRDMMVKHGLEDIRDGSNVPSSTDHSKEMA